MHHALTQLVNQYHRSSRISSSRGLSHSMLARTPQVLSAKTTSSQMGKELLTAIFLSSHFQDSFQMLRAIVQSLDWIIKECYLGALMTNKSSNR